MKLTTELYPDYLKHNPTRGQHILAQQQGSQIAVYQAYKKSIANFAVKNQQLGGNEYSYNRMSWIKPNFLWMMFRCGWAEKENQDRVLALWIEKADFDTLLSEAAVTHYNNKFYDSQQAWKADLQKKEVRLQWDPDHDPFGNKIDRRAIQLGLKDGVLEKFGKGDIRLIEDITDFVEAQKTFVKAGQLDRLLVPRERLYIPADEALCMRVGIDPAV